MGRKRFGLVCEAVAVTGTLWNLLGGLVAWKGGLGQAKTTYSVGVEGGV